MSPPTMFRASPNSRQIDLLSNVEQYRRPRDQQMLNDATAWHNVFLDQVTKRIPEERFSPLFVTSHYPQVAA